jgi:hypothetical protein
LKEQRFCPIQPANQLGAMGAPVKVMLKGERVFLCCQECKQNALENSDLVLVKVRELKANNAGTRPK